jgi:hypothetical protein
VYEGFDPILVAGEIIENHFKEVFNMILDFDFNKSDEENMNELT